LGAIQLKTLNWIAKIGRGYIYLREINISLTTNGDYRKLGEFVGQRGDQNTKTTISHKIYE